MKTIGESIKSARTRKKISRAKLEEETKIKKEFIEAIESEEWSNLPEYPVVRGFVRSIAQTLKVDTRKMLALLRRDYPPKKLRVNPKPDVSDKFKWSPKLTFIAGVVFVFVLVFGYVGFQYYKFTSPPSLEVYKPIEGEIVKGRRLVVTGQTNPQVVLKVNNQPVLVSEDGDFKTEIEIFEGTEEVIIKAISRSGKETVVQRKIVTKLEN